MEEGSNIGASWFSLFFLVAFLTGIYFLLQVLRRVLPEAPFIQAFSEPVKNGLEKFMLLYEPLAIIILVIGFISINPIVNGILCGTMALLGFFHLRNYLSGRLVRLGEGVVKGKVLQVGEKRGTVARLGRLGLRLQTDGGVHHIDYNQLLQEGYTIFSNEEEVGKFRSFMLHLPQTKDRDEQISLLLDQLTNTPYLDWSYKPQIAEKKSDPQQLKLTAFFREERHFQEFSQLIEEWGYGEKAEN